MTLRKEFEDHGWEAPRTQARVANLVSDEAEWRDDDIRDAAWLLNYLAERRELAIEELAIQAAQLFQEHRAITRKRSQVAEPFDIKEAALRTRMEAEFSRAEPPEAIMQSVGLCIADTWKGVVTDKQALVDAIVNGEIEGIGLEAIVMKQPALDAYARRVKNLKSVPGLEVNKVRKVRRSGEKKL
jgi:hypothetical protein